MRPAKTEISDTRFREVLGHYCSGVTVITAIDGDVPVGFACQSFQSLSLNPPMVTFSPARTSTTWPRIQRAGRFAANVLAKGQDVLCRQFATSGGDKFSGVDWRPGLSGAPLLAGALAWVDCEITEVLEGGDHVIVIGRVLDLAADGGSPLLFFRGRFGSLAADC
ncbi:flavin reductase family protein [Streptomyces sp. NPDC006355]|uniref:flavin reductase family protein n=1 Tax=Streptomyces sp. NPDC006355 TaxID=3156758 RepID=UPI0033BF2338